MCSSDLLSELKRTLYGNWQKTTRDLFRSPRPVQVEPVDGAGSIGKHLEFPLQKVLICIIWNPYEEFTSVSNSGLLAVRTETLVLDGSTSSLASLVLAILVNACVINKPDHT